MSNFIVVLLEGMFQGEIFPVLRRVGISKSIMCAYASILFLEGLLLFISCDTQQIPAGYHEMNKTENRCTSLCSVKPCFVATVNQYPPVHHEGWMVSGQETVFCWVPVP